MADVLAKITLSGGATYRGAVSTASEARAIAAHNQGDVLQVYSLRRYYVYLTTSSAADNGDTVLKPDDVVGNGRWVCNTVDISGHPYVVLTLSGSTSSPGDGSFISSYEWVLVDEPASGATPAVLLVSNGVTAELKIPVSTSWRPGGIFVFLRVTNDLGTKSSSDPFDPRTPQFSKFSIISATPEYGFLVPAAGSRNWHKQFRETVLRFEEGLGNVTAGITFSRHAVADKSLTPSSPVTGDQAVVPGVTISATPYRDGYVRVYVNGEAISVGNGSTTSSPCYFSNNSGVSAKTIANIAAGDSLCWNSSVAGYGLDVDDVIEIDYEVSL